MKKVFIVFWLIVFSVFMFGCAKDDVSNDTTTNDETTITVTEVATESQSELNEETTNTPETTKQLEETKTEDITYEIEFVTENQASFLMLVKDNPIDNELFKGPDSGNTQEMVNHYMKYATIWLEELHYSNDQLLPLLNNEDKTLFLSIQSQWEDNLKRENEFINDIFYGDKYDLNPGSIFSVETAYNYCQMIKERTLYVKYLHYCIEDTSNFIPKFLYTGEKSE